MIKKIARYCATDPALRVARTVMERGMGKETYLTLLRTRIARLLAEEKEGIG